MISNIIIRSQNLHWSQIQGHETLLKKACHKENSDEITHLYSVQSGIYNCTKIMFTPTQEDLDLAEYSNTVHIDFVKKIRSQAYVSAVR